MWAELLLRVEVILAVVALLAALKSAWNGWLHKRIIAPLDRLEGMSESLADVADRQEQMVERQELQIDAIIALARSMEADNGEFDEESFRKRVGRESDPEDFLRGGGR